MDLYGQRGEDEDGRDQRGDPKGPSPHAVSLLAVMARPALDDKELHFNLDTHSRTMRVISTNTSSSVLRERLSVRKP